MRRLFSGAGAVLLIHLLAVAGFAQDKLEGRWEGKTVSPQGERATTATFKKEGGSYIGTITGTRGEMPLKDVKLEGDKVTAKAEVNFQGNALVINYSFNLQGEAMKGTGAIDFGGNTINLDIELKRTGDDAAAAAPASSPAVGGASDKLAGRWEGKLQSPQGERDTNLVVTKTGDKYAGKMPGLRPGTEVELKDIKFEGDKLTAKADVETPQGALTINYNFTLAGETMKGQGALDFGGNAFTFDINLKRVTGAATAAAGQAAGGQAPPQRQQRAEVPQPQQKQSIDYFVGQWSYRYVGRESALGPAPREGVVTFTKRADGKSVEGAGQGKHDGGSYQEKWLVTFDEATKKMTFSEKLAGGTTLNSNADWSSPIAIQFTIEPLKLKGQTLKLKRTISIIAAHSFTVTEELSEDGGPFVRLGNAIFSKVNASK